MKLQQKCGVCKKKYRGYCDRTAVVFASDSVWPLFDQSEIHEKTIYRLMGTQVRGRSRLYTQ